MGIDLAQRVVLAVFRAYTRAAGLANYRLPDMQQVANAADGYYPTRLRGGEGHVEVGEVILKALKRQADPIISVKPFGCLPSSSVSDGIQALVTARYPNVNFLSIETTGDGAASVLSRVQMALFKARARADQEFRTALERCGLTEPEASRRLAANSRLARALFYPKQYTSVTAANLVYALAGSRPREK
jgi:predicted nucleotide-binding protein (sugar kinase/HSP70/actin superfamily)